MLLKNSTNLLRLLQHHFATCYKAISSNYASSPSRFFRPKVVLPKNIYSLVLPSIFYFSVFLCIAYSGYSISKWGIVIISLPFSQIVLGVPLNRCWWVKTQTPNVSRAITTSHHLHCWCLLLYDISHTAGVFNCHGCCCHFCSHSAEVFFFTSASTSSAECGIIVMFPFVVAATASWSAFSFPDIPWWLGTHISCTWSLKKLIVSTIFFHYLVDHVNVKKPYVMSKKTRF